MLIRALVIISLFVSCGKQSFELAGAKRKFVIYVPKHAEGEKLPVLFVLHGNPSNGWQMQTWTGMNKTADKYGFIVVYPYASDKRWPTDPSDNSEEIRYFNELLMHIESNYPADSTRFYLSGMSGGGIFSFQLISCFPQTFAAVAVVSGNMPRNPDLIIEPTPFMYIHGTDDFLYDGKEDLFSANESLGLILETNSCVTDGVFKSLPDVNSKDESTVTRITYSCSTPVVYFRVENGGHHWPGASFDANLFYSKPLGAFNKDLNTNEAIWQFCQAFRRD